MNWLARKQLALAWWGPEGVLDPRRPGQWSSLDDWLASPNAAGSVLVVAQQLQLQFVPTEPLPLSSGAGRKAYVEQQVAQYFGAQAAEWPKVLWQSGARGVSQPWGASVLQALYPRPAGQTRPVMLPAWALAWAQAKRSHPQWARAEAAQLLWLEGESLTTVLLRQGAVTSVQSRRLQPQETLTALLDGASANRGACLLGGFGVAPWRLEGVPADCRLTALEPASPPMADLQPTPGGRLGPMGLQGLLGRLDPSLRPLCFEGPKGDLLNKRNVLGGMTLVLAALAAGVAVSNRRLAVEAPLPVAPTADQSPQRLASEVSPSGSVEPTRWADVNRRLRFPWPVVLGKLEQLAEDAAGDAAVPLTWLGLSVDSGDEQLRASGGAESQLAALRSVARWGADPDWREVSLTRVEPAQDGVGGVRFEVRAALVGKASVPAGEPLLPVPSTLQERLGDLLTGIQRPGVALGPITVESQHEGAARWHALRVRTPMKTAYGGLRAVLEAVLVQDAALSLDELVVRRSQALNPELQVEIGWTLHASNSAGAAP